MRTQHNSPQNICSKSCMLDRLELQTKKPHSSTPLHHCGQPSSKHVLENLQTESTGANLQTKKTHLLPLFFPAPSLWHGTQSPTAGKHANQDEGSPQPQETNADDNGRATKNTPAGEDRSRQAGRTLATLRFVGGLHGKGRAVPPRTQLVCERGAGARAARRRRAGIRAVRTSTPRGPR